ncbi:MAG: lysine--tRNA ligase [Patescibacteria group bacterium]|nr:lysine--tRNA ligase [Patescibacteria group bacterium]
MLWTEELTKHFKGAKKELWVDDMATPSGKPHVGTFRGAIIHDVAAKALRSAGLKAKYTFFSNDFDPMDGMPSYLDEKKYREYMGKPFFMIPAPNGKGSLGDYFIAELYEMMKGLGCDFKPMKDSEGYKNGDYDEVIRTVLDNADAIRKIYKEVAGSDKGNDWIPFNPICEKCGKIGTTRAYAWDGKEVSYKCEEDMVDWAKGCGYEGKVSPFGGTGKLPWKVEWPAKFAALGIDVEGEGKDHSSAGGSRDLANVLCKKVFKVESPYDLPYEHIIFKGKKMSKSKGVGISAKDVYESLPPELIRFIMIRNINRVIDLDLDGMVIASIYDEYDRAHKAYMKEIDFPDLAKVFELSQIKSKFNNGYKMKFTKVAHAIQIPNADIDKMAEEEKGSKLNELEKTELKERVKYAQVWLDKFAPDTFKFDVKEKLPKVELTENQKGVIEALAKKFASRKEWNGEELQKEIFNLKDELKVEPKEIFSAIYQLFIGKDSGPQAGFLLASLDYEFVKKRLELK